VKGVLQIRIKYSVAGMFRRKRGRFIPCRGGGTATTYYTDDHNVDEDMMTSSFHGGHWVHGITAGIALRYTIDNYTPSFVASRLIYLS